MHDFMKVGVCDAPTSRFTMTVARPIERTIAVKIPKVSYDWSHELCFLAGALCCFIPMWGALELSGQQASVHKSDLDKYQKAHAVRAQEDAKALESAGIYAPSVE